MRTSNSIKNSTVSFIVNFMAILIGFIAQKIFILILDTEYLGVNGLFTNILSILSIAELGVGEAIVFHLYEPVANNDTEKIKSLLKIYKKAYNIITIIIFCLGICLLPFLQFFIGKTTLDLNFKIIYLIFLVQTCVSYISTYKRSILYSYQKNYILNLIHAIYLVVLNIVQLSLLFLTKNYYLYLIIKVICILFENFVITFIVNEWYPFVTDKNVKKLDKKIEKNIIRRVKAQFYHKIGWIVISATDNIIISKFIGLKFVGLYSNYFLIINSIHNLFSQMILSITASIGNLLVEKDSKKNFEIYKKIRFLNFWIAVFCATSLYLMIQNFIIVWLGKEYLLSNFVLIVLIGNFYQRIMRSHNDLFMNAGGICVEVKYVPIIEACINLISSIILLKYFGLAGVFLGTIISSLALWGYSYPKFVYKKLLNGKYFNYIKETIMYLVLFVLILLCTYKFSTIFSIVNPFMKIIINGIICLILPNLLIILIFHRTDEFKYFIELLKKILRSNNKGGVNGESIK